jgi:hypothetical protein
LCLANRVAKIGRGQLLPLRRERGLLRLSAGTHRTNGQSQKQSTTHHYLPNFEPHCTAPKSLRPRCRAMPITQNNNGRTPEGAAIP